MCTFTTGSKGNINLFSLVLPAFPAPGGSAEPCEEIGACLRTQVRIFKSCNLCPDSSLYHVLFYCSIPDLFLGSFKNDRAGIYCRSVRNYSFLSAPTCPFRRLPPPPSPCSGTAYGSCSFLYFLQPTETIFVYVILLFGFLLI